MSPNKRRIGQKSRTAKSKRKDMPGNKVARRARATRGREQNKEEEKRVGTGNSSDYGGYPGSKEAPRRKSGQT